MSQSIWSIILIAALVISGIYVFRKRRAEGITGIKTALTSLCFYLIGVVNLLAFWLESIGIISWGITIVLLIAGAYFTKYLPPASMKAE
ncbi:MAG: LPXTG cell wall anchor domain-containing protein [Bacillota bacterium]